MNIPALLDLFGIAYTDLLPHLGVVQNKGRSKTSLRLTEYELLDIKSWITLRAVGKPDHIAVIVKPFTEDGSLENFQEQCGFRMSPSLREQGDMSAKNTTSLPLWRVYRWQGTQRECR